MKFAIYICAVNHTLLRKVLTYLLFLFTSSIALAQEENTDIYYAKRYLDINIKKQVLSNKRVEKQQQKVLAKLSKQESRFAKKLKRQDSTAYQVYQNNSVSFDSIRRIQKPDSAGLSRKSRSRTNSSLDTLKGVKNFITDKANIVGADNNLTSDYDDKLSELKNDAVHNEDVNKLISNRTNFLKGIKTKDGKSVSGLKSIQKQSFYSNEKIKAYKQIADDPSVAEQKALEYLQGKEGFDKYLSYSGESGGRSMNGASPAQLEKMGFQTKQKVQESIQKKVGSNNLGSLQQSMGGQVKDYQQHLQKVNEIKNTAKQTQSSLKGLKSVQKPAFKVNPMRGQPFMNRIEQQYNWQTTRATNQDGPAMLSFSYMAGFKHTPKLSYGLGIAPIVGLGSNWNNVRITFEGIGLRSYAAWQWQYGIGAYAGYERTYKQAVFENNDATVSVLQERPHNKKNYSEAVLIGLTKSYKINDKMNGSIQLLYDIWWKEKGLRNPIQLRFATMKN